MGGSGVAGDVLAAVAGPFMPVPVTVAKGYEAPASVGEGTLCFAISYSGDTEETVEAAQAAAVAGARMVVLSDRRRAGPPGRGVGRPAHRAPRVPHAAGRHRIGEHPAARDPGADRAVPGRVASTSPTRCDSCDADATSSIVDGGPAQQLAAAIGRTMPIAYGGDALGGVAAYRFKCQVNENAKAPAFSGALPEMAHNEICGWGQHGDITRQVMTVVRFRHDFEHPQVARRFDLTYDIIDEVVHAIVDVEAEGEGALAQLFDLVIQGDFVSLHLAAEAGVDPGPIPVLTDLKAALAE